MWLSSFTPTKDCSQLAKHSSIPRERIRVGIMLLEDFETEFSTPLPPNYDKDGITAVIQLSDAPDNSETQQHFEILRKRLGGRRFQFGSDDDSFTLEYFSDNNDFIMHKVPWRRCTPNPSLVQKRLTKAKSIVGPADLYNSLRTFESSAGRALKPGETAALSYYSAKKLQTVSYYWKGAAILGTLLWWRARRTFKLPFWRVPKDPSAFNVFPHRSMPFLRGSAANYAWYGQRLGLYLALSTPIGFLLGMSSATMSQVIGIKEDPRTQELIRETRQKMQERIAQGRPVSGQLGRSSPPRRRLPEGQGSQAASEPGYDDSNTNTTTDTNILNDTQMRTRDRRQQPSDQQIHQPNPLSSPISSYPNNKNNLVTSPAPTTVTATPTAFPTAPQFPGMTTPTPPQQQATTSSMHPPPLPLQHHHGTASVNNPSPNNEPKPPHTLLPNNNNKNNKNDFPAPALLHLVFPMQTTTAVTRPTTSLLPFPLKKVKRLWRSSRLNASLMRCLSGNGRVRVMGMVLVEGLGVDD